MKELRSFFEMASLSLLPLLVLFLALYLSTSYIFN